MFVQEFNRIGGERKGGHVKRGSASVRVSVRARARESREQRERERERESREREGRERERGSSIVEVVPGMQLFI